MSRILFVIESLAEGGTERSLVELLPGLQEAGHDLAIAVLFQRPGLEEHVLDLGVEVLHLPGAGWAGWVRGLRRLLRERSPDLVHSMLFRSDLVARFAVLGTGRRLLSSLVGTPYEQTHRRGPATGAWKLALARRIDSWTGRALTDHYHAVSAPVKRAAIERLGLSPSSITVIPRGRDRARLGQPSPDRRERVRSALALGPDDRLVLNVGRQGFEKGQRGLVAVIPRVVATDPRAVFLIAGPRGTATSELELLRMNLGIGDRLRLLGPRDDVPDLLSAADVFVTPTLREGMPGAILEAMAMGLPIVASDIATVREVVEPERSGLLVPIGDEKALAEAILRLLADPPLASRFGARGAEIFEERFTLAASVKGHLELYASLLQAPTSGSRA